MKHTCISAMQIKKDALVSRAQMHVWESSTMTFL